MSNNQDQERDDDRERYSVARNLFQDLDEEDVRDDEDYAGGYSLTDDETEVLSVENEEEIEYLFKGLPDGIDEKEDEISKVTRLIIEFSDESKDKDDKDTLEYLIKVFDKHPEYLNFEHKMSEEDIQKFTSYFFEYYFNDVKHNAIKELVTSKIIYSVVKLINLEISNPDLESDTFYNKFIISNFDGDEPIFTILKVNNHEIKEKVSEPIRKLIIEKIVKIVEEGKDKDKLDEIILEIENEITRKVKEYALSCIEKFFEIIRENIIKLLSKEDEKSTQNIYEGLPVDMLEQTQEQFYNLCEWHFKKFYNKTLFEKILSKLTSTIVTNFFQAFEIRRLIAIQQLTEESKIYTLFNTVVIKHKDVIKSYKKDRKDRKDYIGLISNIIIRHREFEYDYDNDKENTRKIFIKESILYKNIMLHKSLVSQPIVLESYIQGLMNTLLSNISDLDQEYQQEIISESKQKLDLVKKNFRFYLQLFSRFLEELEKFVIILRTNGLITEKDLTPENIEFLKAINIESAVWKSIYEEHHLFKDIKEKNQRLTSDFITDLNKQEEERKEKTEGEIEKVLEEYNKQKDVELKEKIDSIKKELSDILDVENTIKIYFTLKIKSINIMIGNLDEEDEEQKKEIDKLKKDIFVLNKFLSDERLENEENDIFDNLFLCSCRQEIQNVVLDDYISHNFYSLKAKIMLDQENRKINTEITKLKSGEKVSEKSIEELYTSLIDNKIKILLDSIKLQFEVSKSNKKEAVISEYPPLNVGEKIFGDLVSAVSEEEKKGYTAFVNEPENIQEWLTQDEDNIIIKKDKKIYLIQTKQLLNYLSDISNDNICYKCKVADQGYRQENLEDEPYFVLNKILLGDFGLVDLYSLNKINPSISRMYELVRTGEQHDAFIGKSLYDYVMMKKELDGMSPNFVTLVSAKHCQLTNTETFFTLKFPHELIKEEKIEEEELEKEIEKELEELDELEDFEERKSSLPPNL